MADDMIRRPGRKRSRNFALLAILLVHEKAGKWCGVCSGRFRWESKLVNQSGDGAATEWLLPRSAREEKSAVFFADKWSKNRHFYVSAPTCKMTMVFFSPTLQFLSLILARRERRPLSFLAFCLLEYTHPPPFVFERKEDNNGIFFGTKNGTSTAG